MFGLILAAICLYNIFTAETVAGRGLSVAGLGLAAFLL